ncbi:helix-turn-helix domain-containing protein [Clostridium sp. MB05]|jgi:AraC-like DNA-binding protein/quercetin dioxygenase-like cupin family protein
MDNKSYLQLKEQVNHGNMQLPMEVYHVEFTNSADFYSHWHDEMEFIYILNGSAEICIDFKIFSVTNGDFIIIPKGAIHYMIGKENTKISYIALVFNLSLIEGNTLDYSQINFVTPIVQNKLFFKNVISISNVGHAKIVNAFNNLIESYGNKAYGFQLEIKGELFLIFSTIFKEGYVSLNVSSENYSDLIKVGKLKEVIKYIQTNYKNPITIKELADIAQYSEYHFLRFFKSQTGKTCTQYINYFRIQKATLLLFNTNLSITEIAYEVGFGDVSYFIKTFKKFLSISPTKYRKTNL